MRAGTLSALDLALKNGHKEMAVLLTTHPMAKATGNNNFSRPHVETVHGHLKIAARQEDPAYAMAALAAKAEPNAMMACSNGKPSPLMCFAAAGNLDMCRLLMEKNAQISW